MTSLDSLSTSRPGGRIGHGAPAEDLVDADLPLHCAAFALAADEPTAAAHDATLLVAALEEIEARRAALEWLLEAELLSRCLG